MVAKTLFILFLLHVCGQHYQSLQVLLPFTILSNTVLINLLSSTLQTWPKGLSFLCFVKSTTVQRLQIVDVNRSAHIPDSSSEW